MSENFLILTGPMVVATLEGRKTQTRRLLGMSSRGDLLATKITERGTTFTFGDSIPDDPVPIDIDYRFAPDFTAWVKETWRPRDYWFGDTDREREVVVTYAADDESRSFSYEVIPSDWTMPKAAARGNVSPMFMPRWASRIERKVVSVRAEPLQSISEDDALAEGIIHTHLPLAGAFGTDLYHVDPWPTPICHTSAREAYAAAWDRMHGAHAPWTDNPWVVVVEFTACAVRTLTRAQTRTLR